MGPRILGRIVHRYWLVKAAWHQNSHCEIIDWQTAAQYTNLLSGGVHIEWLAMPSYFFHVRIGGALIEDPDGLQLSNANSIRDECRRAVREILAEEKGYEASDDVELVIVDELGRTVAVVPFRS